MFIYLIVKIINLYQRFVSPFLPNTCRFYPTCSEYSKLAFKKYGLFHGALKTVVRILKCHPFHPGGYDPV
ncbi:MAG: membrane protein insertion efficiency factor YidD [Thermoplasmata archaeon]|nr:membrane protein insertion efficiency factor YidD [Deltaproteobacteria bacterium]RLF27119.1 MAG: membrane protein insertion efficiency factor YidD [Thermoplasmata archaeon]